MRGLVASVLGLGLAANGLTMLAVPMSWYTMVPGVVDTGPFNLHFVRDIGVAYVVTGAALVWFAKRPTARSAVQTGAAFLVAGGDGRADVLALRSRARSYRAS
jgi:uncharacterized protein YjeT (DUF2065 family)